MPQRLQGLGSQGDAAGPAADGGPGVAATATTGLQSRSSTQPAAARSPHAARSAASGLFSDQITVGAGWQRGGCGGIEGVAHTLARGCCRSCCYAPSACTCACCLRPLQISIMATVQLLVAASGWPKTVGMPLAQRIQPSVCCSLIVVFLAGMRRWPRLYHSHRWG